MTGEEARLVPALGPPALAFFADDPLSQPRGFEDHGELSLLCTYLGQPYSQG